MKIINTNQIQIFQAFKTDTWYQHYTLIEMPCPIGNIGVALMQIPPIKLQELVADLAVKKSFRVCFQFNLPFGEKQYQITTLRKDGDSLKVGDRVSALVSTSPKICTVVILPIRNAVNLEPSFTRVYSLNEATQEFELSNESLHSNQKSLIYYCSTHKTQESLEMSMVTQTEASVENMVLFTHDAFPHMCSWSFV